MSDEIVWFFGYGSLMWRPGFPVDAFEPARLEGWHRALCITSRHYRGTAERPGLVLGLAEGGSCTGRALGTAAEREAEVLAYLDERELLGDKVYDRMRLPVTLLRSTASVEAWCYVAKPHHPDYVADLPVAEIVQRVRTSSGLTGSNVDYVRNTVDHLLEMGIGDDRLEAVAAALD